MMVCECEEEKQNGERPLSIELKQMFERGQRSDHWDEGGE
jgi:hypothetical protein